MAKSVTQVYSFISRRWVILSLITIAFVAFALRVVFPIRTVFGDGYVNFLEGDAFSRMHYAKQILEMPFIQGFYYAVPRGLLFPWLIALLGHVILIELVGAWLPPIIAIGVIIVVYLIGTELFNSMVGLMAALFVAVIPSEFYHRSLLGYPDHHVAEVLLMTLAVYLIIKVIRSNKIINRYSVSLAFVLFCFLANWTGGILLTGIIGLTAIILFITKEYRKRAVTLAMSCAVGNILYVALGGFIRYFWWLPTADTGNMSVAHASGMSLEMLGTMFQPLSQRTTGELMPLLAPIGSFNIGVLGTNLHLFTITFIVGCVFLWIWRRDKANLFFMIWTAIMLVITFNQRRFLYYFTIPVGLLSAWGIYELGQLVKRQSYIVMFFATVMLVLVSLPILMVIGTSRAFTMPLEWHDALVWLDNEPSDGGMVTAWTDYGHWIQYQTDKEPNYLNGPGGSEVAKLFLTQDDDYARQLLSDLNTEYLIVDKATMGYKSFALEIVAGDSFKATDNSLGNRLLNDDNVSYLQLEYESQSIKIYEHITN